MYLFVSGFDLVVGLLYIEKSMLPYIYSELIRTKPEPLYVNFQWMTIDQKGQRLFVLMGNENTPDKLNARIYTFNLNKRLVLHVIDSCIHQNCFYCFVNSC